MGFNKMKRQEAQSRTANLANLANLAKVRRTPPRAAAALHRRVSLVGDGAKWRITNLNEVARAIASWA